MPEVTEPEKFVQDVSDECVRTMRTEAHCDSLRQMSGPGASPSIICETERLILRAVTMEDADFSFQTTADPLVSRFIGGFRTLDWHRQRIQGIIEHQRVHGFSRWTVVLKALVN